MNERRPIRIGPEFDSLVGQRISRDVLCRALGVEPVLAARETVTWMQFDMTRGMGINALLATHVSEADREPFDCTLAIYESTANPSDSHCVATMDFIHDEEDPSLLRVVAADAPEALQEMPIREALRVIQYVLQGWPMQRERHGDGSPQVTDHV